MFVAEVNGLQSLPHDTFQLALRNPAETKGKKQIAMTTACLSITEVPSKTMKSCQHGNKLNRMTEAGLPWPQRPVHVPSRVSVELIENRLLTELKHQMEASFPPEDLQQIDQVHMFQLLQARQEDKTIIKSSSLSFICHSSYTV